MTSTTLDAVSDRHPGRVVRGTVSFWDGRERNDAVIVEAIDSFLLIQTLGMTAEDLDSGTQAASRFDDMLSAKAAMASLTKACDDHLAMEGYALGFKDLSGRIRWRGPREDSDTPLFVMRRMDALDILRGLKSMSEREEIGIYGLFGTLVQLHPSRAESNMPHGARQVKAVAAEGWSLEQDVVRLPFPHLHGAERWASEVRVTCRLPNPFDPAPSPAVR